MAIVTPTQLVDEFKKSGEFDRLRRELLTQFKRGDGIPAFKSRIEDIARQRLTSDEKLQYLPQESVHRELMQELDRYPIVERAVTDVRILSDPSFVSGIRTSVQKILLEDRGSKPEPDPKIDKANNVLQDSSLTPLKSSPEPRPPPGPISNQQNPHDPQMPQIPPNASIAAPSTDPASSEAPEKMDIDDNLLPVEIQDSEKLLVTQDTTADGDPLVEESTISTI